MEITKLDYYAVFDLAPSATQEQVAGAFKFAVENYAPESLAAYGLLGDDERAGILSFLRGAYRTLADEALRREYDRRLVESGAYAPGQMVRGAAAAPAPGSPAAAAPVHAPAAAAPAPPAPAPAAEPAGQARERAWWPFADKPKQAPEMRPAPVPAAPAPPALPAAAPAAPPAALTVLDGRPLGPAELRQIREARGLRLDEVSQQTKISLSNLRFLEESKFEFLPAAVYVKGFLRTYAKVLRVDAEKLIRDYMAVFDAHRQP
jgi:hypothetical protein